MTTVNERFEVIGALYHRRHHRLRPGKSESWATGRDSSSEENLGLFESWLATNGFTDAIDRIAELEGELKYTEERLEDCTVALQQMSL